MKNLAIVYRLYKDDSPTIIVNLTAEDANKQIVEIRKEYPKAYITTTEKANLVLDEFGKQFEPKKQTQQERWNDWAIGKHLK